MDPHVGHTHVATSLRAAGAIVLTAGLLIACGSPAPGSVQVRAGDSGSHIRVHVGESLALNLGHHAPGPWTLAYPRSFFTLSRADRAQGEFRLVARRVGTAHIVAWSLGSCGLPAMHGPAMKCQLTSLGRLGDKRTRPFTVTVTIAKK
ncbi:MAG: hypothetical protein M3P18_07390 [Actinomycetota bacterium]|nr:hypothetical protein [Actinomycetota bacterium]